RWHRSAKARAVGVEQIADAGRDALGRREAGGPMFSIVGARVRRVIDSSSPWTNVYGVARTLIALGTLATLAFSHSTSIFRPAVGIDQVPQCVGPARASLFCAFGHDHLELARWVAVATLTVVAIGWRPRVTGLV